MVPAMVGGENDTFDAASEINDAMISSLAEVVQNVTINDVQLDENTDSEVEENTVAEESTEEEIVDTTVDDLVAEGEAAHRSGEYDNALEIFNKAIALDPSNAMAWFNRGVLLESKQDPKGAKQSFVICLDLDPNHGPALANLAVLLNRLGDVNGSVEIAERALKFFPGHPYLVNILKENQGAGGMVDTTNSVIPKAQDQFVNQNISHPVHEEKLEDDNEFFNVDEQSDVTNNLEMTVEEVIEEIPEQVIDIDAISAEASQLLASGEPRQAMQLLKPYLHSEASEHFDSWRLAAGAMASMGLDDHAIGAYNHAIGLNPNDEKCFYNLGALHERKSNIDAAIKCFKSALEINSDYTKAANRISQLAQSTGNVEMLIFAKKHLATEPSGKEDYAILLIELAEGEAAILENTPGLPPTIPEGPTLAREAMEYCLPGTKLLARAQSAAGEHTAAVNTWKSMIQNDKSNPDLWTGLARSLENAGDHGSAQRCHEKAASLSNPQPAVVDPLDAFEQQQSVSTPVNDSVPLPQPIPEPEEPIQQIPLPEISERPPETVIVQESRPEIDLAAAALEATANMEQSRFMDANSNSIANQDIEWYNKGVALIEDKKYREALSCFDRALPSFANNDEMVIRILNGRGNALYYLEDYPKCVESYHKAMVINPKGVQGKTLYNMGTAYAEMQRFGDAIKCFEQAVPRGLDASQQKLAKEQIRRCNILLKEQQRKSN